MKYLSIPGLKVQSAEIRAQVIKMIYSAGSGHPAGSLGVSDIITALYFRIMTHDPKKPDWPQRDRLILSNGHVCPTQYAALAYAGYFSLGKLSRLRKFESPLQGHPERRSLPGIETTSGPLGCGLAQAVGIAMAAKLDDARFRTYCVSSDGEHDSGNHWEAVMAANKFHLSNLTLFVDRNNIQIDGPTEAVMPLEPLAAKYKAFGWNVVEINGHDFEEIILASEKARAYYEGPTVIIAETTPGKGVSFMEGNYLWHGKAPNKEETKKALEEITSQIKKLKSKK
jgi:transketolase